jgi:hypothetical protein
MAPHTRVVSPTSAIYPCRATGTMVRNQSIIMYHPGTLHCSSSRSKHEHDFERSDLCPLRTRGISADTFPINRDIKAAMCPQLTSVQFRPHSVTQRVLILYNHAQILNTPLYGAYLVVTAGHYVRQSYGHYVLHKFCALSQ